MEITAWKPGSIPLTYMLKIRVSCLPPSARQDDDQSNQWAKHEIEHASAAVQ